MSTGSIPIYAFKWRVEKVKAYLPTLGVPKHLYDKMLTVKLTMLIALTSPTMAHEIHSLDKFVLVKHLAHYTFHFSKLIKTAKQGKLRSPVELTQFPNKNLCVCHHTDVYLERKKVWLKNEGKL